jgi:ribosome maturation factor RimP
MSTGGVPAGTAGGSEAIGAAVRRIVEPILASLGLVLVEVEVQGRGPKSLVRVVIERTPKEGEAAGGVSVEDCGRVHVLLGHALDVEDPIPHTYVLEISSPGLDRPIRQVGEYERFRGRLARFKLVKPVLGQSVLIGRIHQLEGEQLWVEARGIGRRGRAPVKIVALPLAEIAEARLEVEF